jgi:cobalt/nickel transport system permease protein
VDSQPPPPVFIGRVEDALQPRLRQRDANLHPRTSIALVAAGLAASLAGWHSALVTLACLAVLGLPLPRRLGLLALSLLGGLLTVLILLPFAPRAVADIALRGSAASLTIAVITLGMAWPAAIAELQQLGLPRTVVAFLALLARHVEVLTENAQTIVVVLKVRGALGRRALLPRAVAVLLSRLLVLAWTRADQVADAMALRGFEGHLPRNPPWRPRVREVWQYGLALLMLASAAWEVVR